MFKPDNKYILAVAGNAVRVVEVSSGQDHTPLTHEEEINQIALSPDGCYCATGSQDMMARVWEIATGIELVRIRHEGEVTAVAFSTDGKHLVSGGRDNYVKVSLWRSRDLVAEAKRYLSRNLSMQEWRQYLADEPYRKTFLNLV